MVRKNFKEQMYIDNHKSIDLSNIQKIRDIKGISQVKLSMDVGVSQQSITFYESNTRFPSLPVLVKIADVLDTSIDSIVGRNKSIAKYYELSKTDRETVDRMIESLSNKTANKN